MARKKRGFQWTRENPEGDLPPVAGRPDRDKARAENRALDALGLRLAGLTPGQRAHLPLEPELLEEIELLASLGPKPARKRQVRRVGGLLRFVDLEALERALAGGTDDAVRTQQLERWRTRLLEGDDDDLQAFLEAHRGADRQRLRALIRQARGEGSSAKRSARKLYQLLKAAEPAEPDETAELGEE